MTLCRFDFIHLIRNIIWNKIFLKRNFEWKEFLHKISNITRILKTNTIVYVNSAIFLNLLKKTLCTPWLWMKKDNAEISLRAYVKAKAANLFCNFIPSQCERTEFFGMKSQFCGQKEWFHFRRCGSHVVVVVLIKCKPLSPFYEPR